ncbi:Leishmanolysin [Lutimaribacter pacificus]|uniref:Leishmanolysin n=1 Tax=Lutimaribacter pacificus TaxID=391948 RepID=A0A1H0CLJ1_9RHOB|nr:leishmanolysin-related zinc metalloendopeptidase [Lutimaribacter pacificus]SDN58715.1 Leishmanolysin [Lutimaribacter pacificus]SHJ43236.1 Leishmanolysin [Lutimaribacter pacificus]
MKKQYQNGLRGPLADILPPVFDTEAVAGFFSGGHRGKAFEGADMSFGPGSADTGAPGEAAPGTDPVLPDAAQNAQDGLNPAQERAATELPERAKPFATYEQPEEPDTPFQDAAAKPSWAGGGDKTSDGGGGGGKGKGKNKPVDNGDGSTDTSDSGTDTGMDTGGDTGTDTGTGTATETNPGSNDPNTYISGMDTPDGYNIALVFQGDWLQSQRDALARAAEAISDFITGDVASHNGIDDIELTLVQASIDGGGGAWATGGPRSVRSDSLLPSTGVLTFDTADIDSLDSSGLWEDLGMHEMLHAMGFGTLFSALGLIETVDGQKRFTGANAVEAYHTEFAGIAGSDLLSDIGIALDASGAHWDDGGFTKELMTPYLRYSGNYLSDMSIAAMEDIGYETIYESVTVA